MKVKNPCNPWLKILIVLICLAFPGLCAAQQVVDKMVATVNAGVRTDLITYSDLMWQLSLQPNTVLDNPTSADLNRALRLLIDQRLILQEAEKIPTIVPTQKEVSDAREELARQFASQPEFQQRLRRVGLTSEKIDEIVERGARIAPGAGVDVAHGDPPYKLPAPEPTGVCPCGELEICRRFDETATGV